MNKEEALKKVLEKYKISMPLSPETKKYIEKNKKRVLVNIYKHYNQYNIIIAAALVLYFPLRKIGIAANLVQSAAILFAVSAVTIISIATGGYFVVKKIMLIAPMEKHVIEAQINQNDIKQHTGKEISGIKYENNIIFPGFKSDSADSIIINKLNSVILNELYSQRGQGNIFRNSVQGKGIIFVCSLEKPDLSTDPLYILTIKTVNMETGQILQIKEDSGRTSELSAKAVSLIKEILKTVK